MAKRIEFKYEVGQKVTTLEGEHKGCALTIVDTRVSNSGGRKAIYHLELEGYPKRIIRDENELELV